MDRCWLDHRIAHRVRIRPALVVLACEPSGVFTVADRSVSAAFCHAGIPSGGVCSPFGWPSSQADAIGIGNRYPVLDGFFPGWPDSAAASRGSAAGRWSAVVPRSGMESTIVRVRSKHMARGQWSRSIEIKWHLSCGWIVH
jgi:hypothetical protein